jgi:DNA polymerase III subunit epsilon
MTIELNELKQMVQVVNASDQYRVITKYQQPEYYHVDDGSPKLTGVFLDIETTGLSYQQDKLIELGMVKFEYSLDGRIFRILDKFNCYQDPNIPISTFITELTGIDNNMVKDK